jgi:hypothetical protein
MNTEYSNDYSNEDYDVEEEVEEEVEVEEDYSANYDIINSWLYEYLVMCANKINYDIINTPLIDEDDDDIFNLRFEYIYTCPDSDRTSNKFFDFIIEKYGNAPTSFDVPFYFHMRDTIDDGYFIGDKDKEEDELELKYLPFCIERMYKRYAHLIGYFKWSETHKNIKKKYLMSCDQDELTDEEYGLRETDTDDESYNKNINGELTDEE